MREQSIVAASRRGRIRGKRSHRVSVENHFPEMPQAVQEGAVAEEEQEA